MVIVTTSHNPSKYQVDRASALAKDLKIPYVNRKDLKSADLEQFEYYYVVEKGRITVKRKNTTLFFHPSTAKVRMRNIKNGFKDYLIEALKLNGKELILDTTFGLGSEAILMAAFLSEGKVIGTEASTPIYVVVSHGLKEYRAKEEWVTNAMRKIEVYNDNFRSFIFRQESESFDIVYCDPMFENPVYKSSSMNPLRPFALYETLNEEDIDQMLQVARKKLVLKAHGKDSLFDRIKPDIVMGSRKSGVLYGVIFKR